MTRGAVLRLGAAFALVAPAPAAAGPVYFHKPNVDRETFARDFSHCSDLARGVEAPPPLVAYSPNLYALAVNSFFNGFFRSREKRQMINNVMRTCMTDKGYRRVEVSKEVKRELDRLPERERVDRLFALTAAPQPEGKVLPQ